MQTLLQQAFKIAYNENKKTGMPIKEHIHLSLVVGEKLAEKLNADKDVVEIGILMMDSLIGEAINKGKVQDHIEMSFKKTQELLDNADISDSEKKNILKCVEEHHGTDKFYSIESEICCNADCYRFLSVEGFTYAMRYMREIEFDRLIPLLRSKVDEKWNALTLEICRTELRDQHRVINEYLKYLKRI